MDYETMDYLNRTLDRTLIEQLSRVYYGHELWMDTPSYKADRVSCHVRHGHNMKVDGVAPKQYVNSFVYCPGKSRKIRAEEKEAKDSWLISCPRTSDGDYSFYIDSSSVWCKDAKGKWSMGPKSNVKKVAYSGAYNLVAKKIVSVKANGDFSPKAHTVLDIMPDKRRIKFGEEISFKVKYEGKNLKNGQMKAYCRETEKESLVDIVNGRVVVNIDSKGTWMFLVRYRDENKKVDDAFDETVFVTTLVMETP